MLQGPEKDAKGLGAKWEGHTYETKLNEHHNRRGLARPPVLSPFWRSDDKEERMIEMQDNDIYDVLHDLGMQEECNQWSEMLVGATPYYSAETIIANKEEYIGIANRILDEYPRIARILGVVRVVDLKPEALPDPEQIIWIFEE